MTRTNSFIKDLRAGALLLAGGLAGLLAGSLAAQSVVGGRATGYRTYQFFDPPHQTQLKTLIEGAEATADGQTRVRLKGLHIETFQETGESKVQVDAPECVYDFTAREAGSAGRISARTGDGRLRIEGTGFLFQQARSRFTISNDVHTLIRGLSADTSGTKPSAANSNLLTHIWSESMDFDVNDAKTIRPAYRGNMQVEDPRMALNCALLTVHISTNGLSTNSSHRVDAIVAEQDVVLLAPQKDGTNRVTAQKAVYTSTVSGTGTNEWVELTGNPAWSRGRLHGSADRLLFHPAEQSFEGVGNVAITIPRSEFSQGGFLLSSTKGTRSPVDEGVPVQVFAGHLVASSNLTVASGNVRVLDGTNSLLCERLTWVAGNSITMGDRLTADGGVTIAEGGRRVTAQRLDYNRQSDQAQFTGQTAWMLDQTEGRADELVVQPAARSIAARGNAWIKLQPPPGSASALLALPAKGQKTGQPAPPAQPVEINADAFQADQGAATATGHVRAHESPATGAEPRLQCDSLEVRFNPGENRVASLAATGNVVMERGTIGVTNGPATYQKLSARTAAARMAGTGKLEEIVCTGDVHVEDVRARMTAQRLTYAAGPDVFTLSGKPSITAPEGTTQAEEFIWDHANGTIRAKDYTTTPSAEVMEKATPPSPKP